MLLVVVGLLLAVVSFPVIGIAPTAHVALCAFYSMLIGLGTCLVGMLCCK